MQFLRCSSLALVLWAVLSGGMRADEDVKCRLFHARADHPWNALHAALWMRPGADSTVYGENRLDPLLWADTRHLTTGPSLRKALVRLEVFLRSHDPKLEQDSLKRAFLQRDLWAVFDWLANREHNRERLSNDPKDRALRRKVLVKLAAAIQRLALRPAEMAKLPPTYDNAVRSAKFPPRFDPDNKSPFLPPRMLDPDGPWVGLGTSDGPIAPAHVRGESGFSRSAITVFLRLPGDRQATVEYLKRLVAFETPWIREPLTGGSSRMVPNPKTPQFPAGTQTALVRRMLLVDSHGQLAATPIVEQLQFRVYKRLDPVDLTRRPPANPPQAFFEFVLDRKRLFAGKAGGLRAVGAEERDFGAIPFSHGIDPIDNESTQNVAARRRMGTVLQSCAGCHQGAGVLSLNSYTRRFGPRSLRAPSLYATGTNRADQMIVIAKQRRYDWGLLSGLWSTSKP